jgi:hypothetical protein
MTNGWIEKEKGGKLNKRRGRKLAAKGKKDY